MLNKLLLRIAKNNNKITRVVAKRILYSFASVSCPDNSDNYDDIGAARGTIVAKIDNADWTGAIAAGVTASSRLRSL